MLLLDISTNYTKGQKYYPDKNDSYPPFSNTPVNIIENKKKAGNNCKIKEIQKWTIKLRTNLLRGKKSGGRESENMGESTG